VGMILLSIVKIAVVSEKREELLKVLRSIRGPAQAMSGCLEFRIWVEDEDDGEILLLEHWQSWESFMQHVRSDLYTRMLEALELSREEPVVSFFDVSAIRGMDFITAVRNQKS
jgi:quinol monooxygenase YgiN